MKSEVRHQAQQPLLKYGNQMSSQLLRSQLYPHQNSNAESQLQHQNGKEVHPQLQHGKDSQLQHQNRKEVNPQLQHGKDSQLQHQNVNAVHPDLRHVKESQLQHQNVNEHSQLLHGKESQLQLQNRKAQLQHGKDSQLQHQSVNAVHSHFQHGKEFQYQNGKEAHPQLQHASESHLQHQNVNAVHSQLQHGKESQLQHQNGKEDHPDLLHVNKSQLQHQNRKEVDPQLHAKHLSYPQVLTRYPAHKRLPNGKEVVVKVHNGNEIHPHTQKRHEIQPQIQNKHHFQSQIQSKHDVQPQLQSSEKVYPRNQNGNEVRHQAQAVHPGHDKFQARDKAQSHLQTPAQVWPQDQIGYSAQLQAQVGEQLLTRTQSLPHLSHLQNQQLAAHYQHKLQAGAQAASQDQTSYTRHQLSQAQLVAYLQAKGAQVQPHLQTLLTPIGEKTSANTQNFPKPSGTSLLKPQSRGASNSHHLQSATKEVPVLEKTSSLPQKWPKSIVVHSPMGVAKSNSLSAAVQPVRNTNHKVTVISRSSLKPFGMNVSQQKSIGQGWSSGSQQVQQHRIDQILQPQQRANIEVPFASNSQTMVISRSVSTSSSSSRKRGGKISYDIGGQSYKWSMIIISESNNFKVIMDDC